MELNRNLLLIIVVFVISSATAQAAVPIFYTPNPKTSTRFVYENSRAGASIITIDATDADGDKLTYSILTQAPNSPPFELESLTGTLKTPFNLDAETSLIYNFTFSVTDGKTTVDSIPFRVIVKDLNEFAPVFTDESYSTTVLDWVKSGHTVLTVTATDRDATDTVTYRITSGNTENEFTISNNGEIKTAATLTRPRYTLGIQASDGIKTTDAIVTITVNETTTKAATTQTTTTSHFVTTFFKSSSSSRPTSVTSVTTRTPTSVVIPTTFIPTPDESRVPDKVDTLVVRSAKDALVVQWLPNRRSNTIVRGYIIEYGNLFADIYQNYKIYVDANTFNYTIDNLVPATAYGVSLQAYNNKGIGQQRYETVFTKRNTAKEATAQTTRTSRFETTFSKSSSSPTPTSDTSATSTTPTSVTSPTTSRSVFTSKVRFSNTQAQGAGQGVRPEIHKPANLISNRNRGEDFRRRGPTRNQFIRNDAGCTSEPADIVFVLDSSYSIWPPDFERELQFMDNVIETFNIGPGDGKSRVGALTFGHGVWPKFYLNTYTDISEIKRAISYIQYEEGKRTNTGDALTFARDVMFSERAGARENSTKIAIVVTDGMSQKTFFTKDVARYLQEDGITMFAVSIGYRLDETELAAIASDPDDNFYFSVNEYSSIKSVRDRIDEKICGADGFQAFKAGRTVIRKLLDDDLALMMKDCNGKRADIYFVIDSSYSINEDNFAKEMEFVLEIIKILDIGPNTTRIGVMTFSDTAKFYVKLDYKMERKEDYKTILNSAKFMGGGTNTATALRKMREDGFYGTMDKDRGEDIARIAIIMTDGLSIAPDVTAREAELARKVGIQLFAVGIGEGIDKQELTDIASKPTDKFLLHVDDFGSLLNIKLKLAARSCTVEPLESIPGLSDVAICHPRKPTDLLFVYDALTLGSWRSQTISQFAEKSLEEFNLMNGDLRVGREIENCPSGNIALGSVLQSSDLSRVEYQSLTNMLRRVSRQRFSSENGGRVNASRMVVVFVDTSQRINHDTFLETQKLKDNVDFLYIVTIGENARSSLLKNVADKGHTISVKRYDDLMAYADKLMADMCDFFFVQ